MNKYIIYKITNLINNKIYIGKTIKTLQHRWSIHKAHAKNPKTRKSYFARAIYKYGPENFLPIILEYHDCKHILKQRECELIQEYQSNNPSIGYNLVIDSINDISLTYLSDDVRKQISLSSHKVNRKVTQSGFRGVYWGNEDGNHNITPWVVSFSDISGQKIRKRFSSKLEAAQLFDKFNVFKYGKDAILNFPEMLSEYLKEDLSLLFNNIFVKSKTSSLYQGVSYNKKCNRYLCRIQDGKTRLNLGFYINEIDAAEAHDKINLYLYGDTAVLNFPEKRNKYLQNNDLKEFYLRFQNPIKQRLRVSSSKFRGVTKHGQSNIWCVEIRSGKERIRKTFKIEEDAAKFYDAVAFKNWGYKAKLNFPENYQVNLRVDI